MSAFYVFDMTTPVVDDDYSRVKKKPCLDDGDKNPPLDKDRDTMPGLEEQSSRPGPVADVQINHTCVLISLVSFVFFSFWCTVRV